MNRIITIGWLVATVLAINAQVPTWRVKPMWDSVEWMGYGMMRMANNGQWGARSINGQLSIACQYAQVTDISENYFLLLGPGNRLLDYCDITGKTIKPHREVYVASKHAAFSDGLLAVRNTKGKWGFINPAGNYVINGKYDAAFPFCHGLAAVKQGHVWFYINKSGKTIDMRSEDRIFQRSAFDFASSFTEIDGVACAMVHAGGRFYLIDTSGKRIGNDFITEDGVKFSAMRINFGEPIACDGLSITFDDNGRIVMLHNGRNTFSVPNSNETFPSPAVSGLQIGNDNSITVGGVKYTAQLQAIIPLDAATLLVRQDSKWGLMEIDHSQQAIGLTDNTDGNTYHEGDAMTFGLSDNWSNVKVYVLSDNGRHEVAGTDNVYQVPVMFANSKRQLVLQLERDGIAQAAEVFDIPKEKKKVTAPIAAPDNRSDNKPGNASAKFKCWAKHTGPPVKMSSSDKKMYCGEATIAVYSSAPCTVSCNGAKKEIATGNSSIKVKLSHVFGASDSGKKTVNVTFIPRGGKAETKPVIITVEKLKKRSSKARN